MNNFIGNLVRRAAGLAPATIQAPPPSPFEAGIGIEAHTLAPADVPQQAASGHAASEAVPRTHAEAGRPGAAAPGAGHPAAPGPGTAPAPVQAHVAMPVAGIREAAATRIAGPAGGGAPAPVGAPGRPATAPTPAPAQQAVPDGRQTGVARTGTAHDGQSVPRAAIGEPRRHGLPAASGEPRRHGVAAAPAEPPPAPPRDAQRTPREQAPPVPTIRPALPEAGRLNSFPRAAPAPSAPVPVHVRIGTVEVRAAPPAAAAPAAPAPSAAAAPPAALGFDAYYRARTYRG
jgi:hypothetical protein